MLRHSSVMARHGPGEVRVGADAPYPIICDEEDETSLPVSSLAADLSCPVCLGILKNAVATECLHRFCHNCIEKCLRQGKKECPSCRRHVATRRSLRPDANFDRLIAALLPDLEGFELEQYSCLDNYGELERRRLAHEEQLHKQAEQLAARSRHELEEYERELAAKQQRERILRAQAAVRTKRLALKAAAAGRRPRGGEEEELTDEDEGADALLQPAPGRPAPPRSGKRKRPRPAHAAASDQHAPALAGTEAAPDSVTFAVVRHPEEVFLGDLEKEVLQTSRRLQVHHVLKFLVLRLQLKESAWTSFRLSLRLTEGTAGRPPPPPSLMLDLSLGSILQEYLSDERQLVLEYRLASGFSYSDVQQEPPALGMPLALAAADVDGDVPPDGATTPVSGRAASPTLPPMPPPAEVTVPPPPVAPVAIAPTAVDDGPTSGGA